MQLDPEDLGLLGAAFFYAFALVQLPLGMVLDRAGARRTMVILNMVGMAGTLIFSQAHSLTMGVLGRALLGIGMSANLMGSLLLLTRWFTPTQFATVSGLFLALGTLGSLGATSPLAVLVALMGWRGSFVVLTLCHAILLFVFILIVRDAPAGYTIPAQIAPRRKASTASMTSLKILFSDWSYWAISMSLFLRYGAYASIQALWAGPFLMEYLGLSPVLAGNLILMLSFGFILGSPSGGIISDRLLHSRKNTVLLGSSITGAGVMVVSAWSEPAWLLLLGILLFLIGFFASLNQVSYAHIKELMPADMSGTAMAGINFFTMFGGGAFMHGLGGIMKSMGEGASGIYSTAFVICGCALFINVGLYLTTRDSVS
ncbi:MAG: MFS transporter [Deltaproteobacteria bacterium]|nr:MFS transporter [Deltaproteobacteria bacterium]